MPIVYTEFGVILSCKHPLEVWEGLPTNHRGPAVAASLQCHLRFPTCVSVSGSKSPCSYKDTRPTGLRAPPNPVRPHLPLTTPAKTLFPNTVTVIHGRWTDFGGVDGHSPTTWSGETNLGSPVSPHTSRDFLHCLCHPRRGKAPLRQWRVRGQASLGETVL